MRMYTPYVGYMVCRWLLILFIWVAYIFDFWPFKKSWLWRTNPLIKGVVLTLFSTAAMVLLIKGFFVDILGNYGIAYFNPDPAHRNGPHRLLRHRVCGGSHHDVRGHRLLAVAELGRGL